MTAVPPTKPGAEDGICEQCGYALLHEQAVCPECGATIDWERQRRGAPTPIQPQTTTYATSICVAVIALFVTICLIRGVPRDVLLYGTAAITGLTCVMVFGFSGLIAWISGPRNRHLARWWIALSPIWIATMACSAPPMLVQAIISGSTRSGSVGSSIGFLLLGMGVNGVGILTATLCQYLLWGVLAFGVTSHAWPKAGSWKVLAGAFAGLVVLCVLPAMYLTPLLAIAFGVPILIVTSVTCLLARTSMPHPSAGLRRRTVPARVRITIIAACLLSAIGCGAFNFWWAGEFFLVGW